VVLCTENNAAGKGTRYGTGESTKNGRGATVAGVYGKSGPSVWIYYNNRSRGNHFDAIVPQAYNDDTTKLILQILNDWTGGARPLWETVRGWVRSIGQDKVTHFLNNVGDAKGQFEAKMLMDEFGVSREKAKEVLEANGDYHKARVILGIPQKRLVRQKRLEKIEKVKEMAGVSVEEAITLLMKHGWDESKALNAHYDTE